MARLLVVIILHRNRTLAPAFRTRRSQSHNVHRNRDVGKLPQPYSRPDPGPGARIVFNTRLDVTPGASIHCTRRPAAMDTPVHLSVVSSLCSKHAVRWSWKKKGNKSQNIYGRHGRWGQLNEMGSLALYTRRAFQDWWARADVRGQVIGGDSLICRYLKTRDQLHLSFLDLSF